MRKGHKGATRPRLPSASQVNITLQAIVYREDDAWLAHCLEMDIVAEGRSSAEALRSLNDLFGLQIRVALEEGSLESIFRPAPAEIWKLYALADPVALPSKPVKPVSRLEARELELA